MWVILSSFARCTGQYSQLNVPQVATAGSAATVARIMAAFALQLLLLFCIWRYSQCCCDLLNKLCCLVDARVMCPVGCSKAAGTVVKQGTGWSL